MSGEDHSEPLDEPIEEAAASPKRSCLRQVLSCFLYLAVLLLLATAAAVFVGYMAYDHVTRPRTPGPAVRVEIPKGATGYDVGRLLSERGLAEHELFFRAAIHFDSTGGTIKHGKYDLPQSVSPTQLLEILYAGPNVRLTAADIPDEMKVTIPEGLSLNQAAALFDNPEAFLEAASDTALIERMGIDAETLEGFIMPNTYFFDHVPSERDVVERAVEQFDEEFAELVQTFPEAAARDRLELVTVASLIEEEAVVDEERPVVAAVIYNRLERNMALELDVTLQYVLGKYGQRMLYRDKEVDSPYNTYANRGLPPGPISSPGLASLRAALNPSDEKVLFFVSNADGRTHTFSSTMAEHTKAVKRYRKEMRTVRQRERSTGND